MASLDLGKPSRFYGDITTLNVLGFGAPRAVETMLGYRPGRLAQGYFILLLIEPLLPDDFEFAGTTLRSGGRLGRPLHNQTADGLRRHVSEQMRDDYGTAHYEAMRRRQVAVHFALTGPNRIAKVLPAERLGDRFDPAVAFPMGGGAGQWTINKNRPKLFLVALLVTPDQMAHTPDFTVSLAAAPDHRQPYANDPRARVQRYLQTAR